MIEDIVHILQRIASIWLSLSVIYPVVDNKIMSAAQRNHPRDYYHLGTASAQPPRLMLPALATLATTILDIAISAL